MSASDAETPGRSGPAWARPADVVDLFVYVVVLNLAAEYLPLVGSKFVVLEAVALLFAGRVQLGGFFAVTGLILALLIARAGVRWLLGEPRGT